MTRPTPLLRVLIRRLSMRGGESGRVAAEQSSDPRPEVETAFVEEKPLVEPDALGIYFDPVHGHYKLDKRGRRYPGDETGTR